MAGIGLFGTTHGSDSDGCGVVGAGRSGGARSGGRHPGERAGGDGRGVVDFPPRAGHGVDGGGGRPHRPGIGEGPGREGAPTLHGGQRHRRHRLHRGISHRSLRGHRSPRHPSRLRRRRDGRGRPNEPVPRNPGLRGRGQSLPLPTSSSPNSSCRNSTRWLPPSSDRPGRKVYSASPETNAGGMA